MKTDTSEKGLESLMRSATAAGLDKVALLQEPIAAAMASIANSKNKNGQFLVYDLGGGTFDAAIVQSISGAANIVAHSGINMLGGRDFDRMIINSIVRPWLLKNFDLPDDFQIVPKYQRLLRIAQYRTELTKINLSTQILDQVSADENQINTKDQSNNDIYLDVKITRADLDKLIDEEIDRTIDSCRSLLKDNGYRPDDIDRVIMIGGPSRMPLVRDLIANQLGIRVDLETDPMTAVAFGACLYAEGRDWVGTVASAKKSRASVKLPGRLDIRFDYPARTTEEKIRIRARVSQGDLNRGMRIQADTDDGWTSGQLPLSSKFEIDDVPLSRFGPNRIRITVLDETGKPHLESSSEFTITRVQASADGMPLMHNIAVKVVGGAIGAETNVLQTIIRKGTSVPTSGGEIFRAARDMRAGDGTTLDFELYQQADGVSDPDLNLPIGVFSFDSKALERGEMIRRGDDVAVHWMVDANGLLSCTLEFKSIGQIHETGKMYVPTAGHKNFDGEDGWRLAVDALRGASRDTDELEKALGSLVAANVVSFRRRIARQDELLKLSRDADTRRSVSEESRLVRQEIARMKDKPEFVKTVLRAEIDGFMEYFSIHFAGSIDEKINAQINRLASFARDALGVSNQHGIGDARKSFDEMRALFWAEIAKRPDYWESMFENYAQERHKAIDKSKHDELARRGEAAIAGKDLDELREVTISLRKNLVQDPKATNVDILAGLMR